MSSRTPSDVIKKVTALFPQSVAAGGTPTAITDVDTTGFRWALVVLNMGDVGAGTASTLEVSASPTSGGTYAAVTDDNENMTGGTDGVFTLTSESGVDNKSYYGEIDLEQFDRFLKFEFTGGGTDAQLAQADLYLFECRDTLEYIVNDATSIKNVQQHQFLANNKPAW